MADTPHIRAVTAAVDRWYRVESPSAQRCMDGAIRVYLEAMKRAGWQLVPREANHAMHWAGVDHKGEGVNAMFRQMLAAAPDPTQGGT